jgi:hypothetical protein
MSRDRTRIIGVVVLAVGALLLSAPVMAQSGPPSSPVVVDPLLDALLQAGDLPDDFTAGGSQEGSDFGYDPDVFAANGGERIVSQVWTSPTGGVVFDFRYAFPSETAAADYLLAAMPTLSEEAASGLTLAGDGLVGADDVFHWSGDGAAGDIRVDLDNWVFRVGPMAAKVFVAGVGLTDGVADEIALNAVARMTAAAAAPVTSPGASASLDPGKSEAPGSAEPALAHVPPAIAGACSAMDPSGSETSIVSCRVDDHHQAIYALYVNGIAVDGDFSQITGGLAPTTTGSCADGPYLGPWTVGEEVIGQIACFVDGGQAYLVAGDKRVPMIVFLMRDDADVVALHERLPELAPVP